MSHKTFLKWVGNKFPHLEKIVPYLPREGRLIDVFCGSSSLLLNTNYEAYWLNDINPDLIELYRLLQEAPNILIDDVRELFLPKHNTENAYYDHRQRFNKLTVGTIKRAALFLYLNRHCYNGLCRYNADGQFNVPYGHYKSIYFPEKELWQFSQKLKKTSITMTSDSFEIVMRRAKPGDIVYCDPPYAPRDQKTNFSKYQKEAFTLSQQKKLAMMAIELKHKKIPVIISNHHTPLTEEIYREATIKEFPVSRMMSRRGEHRSTVKELVALFIPEATPLAEKFPSRGGVAAEGRRGG